MPLPFLIKDVKKQTGIAVQERAPDKKDNEDQDDSGLKACAEDILRAIRQDDSQHLAQALKAAFEICDSQPHEEGEHTNDPSPHSYEAQNQKAAKDR